MVQHWNPPQDDKPMFDEQEQAESVLSLHNRHAPAFLQGERLDQYERRLTQEVQKQAPNFKDVNLYDAKGDAYKILKQQVYDDARREALHPTNIPDGELKQVTRYDASGRPSYEFYGRPSTWMSQFSYPKKRLAGILNPTSYQKV